MIEQDTIKLLRQCDAGIRMGIDSIDELPAHLFDEILHFFSVYKQLENKQTDIKELYDRETAEKIVKEAIDGYVDKFCR